MCSYSGKKKELKSCIITSSLRNRVCSQRPCWRSNTIKRCPEGNNFHFHANIFYCFTPPTWPLRTHSIVASISRAREAKNKEMEEVGGGGGGEVNEVNVSFLPSSPFPPHSIFARLASLTDAQKK